MHLNKIQLHKISLFYGLACAMELRSFHSTRCSVDENPSHDIHIEEYFFFDTFIISSIGRRK